VQINLASFRAVAAVAARAQMALVVLVVKLLVLVVLVAKTGQAVQAVAVEQAAKMVHQGLMELAGKVELLVQVVQVA
jgi:hypothetical protein